jgi:hypothetical protein
MAGRPRRSPRLRLGLAGALLLVGGIVFASVAVGAAIGFCFRDSWYKGDLHAKVAVSPNWQNGFPVPGQPAFGPGRFAFGGGRKDPPPEPPKPRDDVPVPQPRDGGEPLAAPAVAVPDLDVRRLGLPAGVLPCPCWSADGRAFFCLEDNGTLRRVALDGFRQEKRLDLGQHGSWLAPSAEGLLATLDALGEVWVIDPDTLTVKRRVAVPGVEYAVCSAGSSFAFAPRRKQPGDPRVLGVLDLAKGVMVRDYQPEADRNGFEMLRATPDGKYLIGTDGGRLVRYRIDGTAVLYEQTGPAVAVHPAAPCVSPDGKYACLPCAAGNTSLAALPVPAGATYVFEVADLSRPAFALQPGTGPACVGFDPAAGALYGQDQDNQLITCDARGVPRRRYSLENAGAVKQFLVHPEGRRLLILTDAGLFHARLTPAALEPPPPGLPEPRAGGEELAGHARHAGDAAVTELAVNAAGTRPCVAWDAPGRSFYLLDLAGTVRRVGLDGFREEASLETERSVSWLAVSAAGVLLTLPEQQEVWLLNPQTLRVKKQFAVPGVRRAVSVPGLAGAVVLLEKDRVGTLTLPGGAVKESPDARGPDAVLTPDGKFVLARRGDGLARFRVADEGLTIDPGQGPTPADDALVCLPAGTGKGLKVYAAGDLTRPALALPDPHTALAFDGAAGVVYADDPAKRLLVTFDRKGVRGREYRLSDHDVQQVAVHPDGRKFLALAKDRLCFVALPRGRE